MEPKILTTKPSADYELIDSGDGEKLERYGKYVLRRPDPQALWKKILSDAEWKKADTTFDGDRKVWKKKTDSMQNEWQISFDNLKFNIKPTAFKHTGVFPEQEPNWQFIKEKIKNAGRPIKVLNLFGYTGGTTLAALSAGAEVAHVDGSKSAITWAKENDRPFSLPYPIKILYARCSKARPGNQILSSGVPPPPQSHQSGFPAVQLPFSSHW